MQSNQINSEKTKDTHTKVGQIVLVAYTLI